MLPDRARPRGRRPGQGPQSRPRGLRPQARPRTRGDSGAGLRRARGSPSPRRTLTAARAITDRGDPRIGMTRNGIAIVPSTTPVVFDPEDEPRVPAHVSVIGRNEPGGERKREADGSGGGDNDKCPRGTDRQIERAPRDQDRPDGGEGRDQELRRTEPRERRDAAARADRHDQWPQGEPDEEEHEDRREHVGDGSGTGRQKPRPQGLVSKRGQPGRERHHERETPNVAGTEATGR